MIVEQISEELEDFPKMSVVLKAYKDVSINDERKEESEVTWCVVFYIPPPDGRFNAASIGCGDENIKELIQILTSAIKKAVFLRSKDISAKYSKSYKCDGFYRSPRIELIVENGCETLRILIANDTQELFVGLTIDEALHAVKVLNYTLSRGPELLNELKDIV